MKLRNRIGYSVLSSWTTLTALCLTLCSAVVCDRTVHFLCCHWFAAYEALAIISYMSPSAEHMVMGACKYPVTLERVNKAIRTKMNLLGLKNNRSYFIVKTCCEGPRVWTHWKIVYRLNTFTNTQNWTCVFCSLRESSKNQSKLGVTLLQFLVFLKITLQRLEQGFLKHFPIWEKSGVFPASLFEKNISVFEKSQVSS